MEFIKNSIIQSDLSKFINFDTVDWVKCSEYACNTIVKNVCNFWKDNNYDILLTSKHYKLSTAAIRDYLKKGNEIGWCLYPYYSYRKVIVFKGNKYIGIFNSAKYLENISQKDLNVRLSQTQIINNCNANKNGFRHKCKEYYFIYEPYYIELSDEEKINFKIA